MLLVEGDLQCECSFRQHVCHNMSDSITRGSSGYTFSFPRYVPALKVEVLYLVRGVGFVQMLKESMIELIQCNHSRFKR
jgi:hypothetical protein